MKRWQFYRLSDGLFTGQSFNGPDRMLEANTPEGCGAIEGSYDRLTKMVDLETGLIIDRPQE